MKSAYRMTLADRLGPDAYLLLRFAVWGVAMGIIAAVIAVIQAKGEGASGSVVVVRAVLAALTVCVLVTAGTAGCVYVAAAAMAVWVAPRGSGRPVEPDFSLQDAMLMRGDVAGALHAYELLIATTPADPRVRIRAAEVYAGPGARPRRARELFEEARGLPRVPAGIDIHATNRLVDLYLGPLDDGRAARAELSGLAHRYHNTPIGAQAEEALRRLGPVEKRTER